MPAGSEIVVIEGGVGAALIVMCKDFEADRFAASVTFAVKSNSPAVVGVPEIAPAPDSVKPGGRLPPAADHVYGAAPPLADNVCA
jgi:hypothetical protein